MELLGKTMPYNLLKYFNFIFCFSDAGRHGHHFRRRFKKSDASKIIVRDAKANRFLNNEIGDRSRVNTFVKKKLKTDEQRPF